MIFLTYLLYCLTSKIQGRGISSDVRRNNWFRERDLISKHLAKRPLRMRNDLLNPTKSSIMQNSFQNLNITEDESKDDFEKYFHSKPVREIGFGTDSQVQKLGDVFVATINIDSKISQIKNVDLRDALFDIYDKIILMLNQFFESRNLEWWRYLRIDRVLSKFDQLSKLLYSEVFDSILDQKRKKNIKKIQDDLEFLAENVFNRLHEK